MQNNNEDRLKDQDADATSNETVKDLETSEKVSRSGNAPGESRVPSPDGAFDEADRSERCRTGVKQGLRMKDELVVEVQGVQSTNLSLLSFEKDTN
ncbi:MAG: hypothetical protein ACREA9_21590 [Pyrinomonadaceae bacterium]